MIWFLSRFGERIRSVIKPGRPVIGWDSVGSLRVIPLSWRDNQGGTANVFSSLRSFDLRAFLFQLSRRFLL